MPSNRSIKKAPKRWGTITDRKEGGVLATCHVNGKRERKVLPTTALAATWVEQMWVVKCQADSGVVAPPAARVSDVRFADLGKAFTSQLSIGVKRKPTHDTLLAYQSETRQMLTYWGPRVMSAVKENDIKTYVGTLQKEGYASTSIRNRLDRLSQMLDYAVAVGAIQARPCKVRRPAAILASRPEARSDEEVTLMAANRTGNALALVLLSADAGLRRAEIFRLKPKDLTKGWIHVAVRGEDERTKSGTGRDVPVLTPRLAAALSEISWGPWPACKEAVADQATGPWEAAGLEGPARMHEFRRRFATWQLDLGTPLVRSRDSRRGATPCSSTRAFTRAFGRRPGRWFLCTWPAFRCPTWEWATTW